MSHDDLERQLAELQIRAPDPAFMAGLKARVQAAQGAPLRSSWAMVNGGLAAAILLVLLVQPGVPAGQYLPMAAPDVASVDAVREAYRPGALAAMERLQYPARPRDAWPDASPSVDPMDSRREEHDQTLGFLAAQ